LQLGLSPQITTISTSAPVIAEARLRSGKAGSGRAAATPDQPGDHDHPQVRGRQDHAARRLGFRHQEGDRRLHRRRHRVLSFGEPQQTLTTAIGAIDEHA
jgi:hypothetical protein